MTVASFQTFCRTSTGTTLDVMADAHALCDLAGIATGDIAARLGDLSGLSPDVAVLVALTGTDTELETYFNSGDANSILLEDGSGFLTMETGDLILME